MFRPRIIPVLLLRNDHLVKSVQFRQHQYIGDVLNAVRILSEFNADELILLDIDATRKGTYISPEVVKHASEEAGMPFIAGGGITNCLQIEKLVAAGAEKVVIGTSALTNPAFIGEAVKEFGSSTISVCMDVKKTWLGKETVWCKNATVNSRITPEKFSVDMEERGAGEIIIQSVTNDGMMNGYNTDLVRRISSQLKIPSVALGGAGNLSHLKALYNETLINGLAAASLFLYFDSGKGVLINYPERTDFSND